MHIGIYVYICVYTYFFEAGLLFLRTPRGRQCVHLVRVLADRLAYRRARVSGRIMLSFVSVLVDVDYT